MTNEAPTAEESEQLSLLINSACAVLFFTGAGISTESGIADFRSPGGIWSKMQPIQFRDFLADEDVRLEDWRRRFHFQKQFDEARPNAGHFAVSRVMSEGAGLAIITQNIDGLHQRSGTADSDIIEIHGNGTRAACLECGDPMSLKEASELIAKTQTAPRCGRCGGLIKAAVISFGQPMPQEKMVRAEDLCHQCDLFVVLGSSLVVQPAATLPVIARNSGAKLVIVNQDETPLDALAQLVINAPIGATLASISLAS